MFRKITMSLLVLLIVFFSADILAKGTICSIGDKVRVLWKGKWYPGTVKKVKGAKCYVNPDGFEDKWNQWVGSDRLKKITSKYEVGDTVYVHWNNKWWLSEIRKVRENSWKVHYKGQSDLYDEWVGPDRIKEYSEDD